MTRNPSSRVSCLLLVLLTTWLRASAKTQTRLVVQLRPRAKKGHLPHRHDLPEIPDQGGRDPSHNLTHRGSPPDVISGPKSPSTAPESPFTSSPDRRHAPPNSPVQSPPSASPPPPSPEPSPPPPPPPPPSPEPSPPPPPPPSPAPPQTPIKATCAATSMYMESGCQLRVTSAEPGSKLFLRFTARPGGEQNVTLRMPRNSSTDTLMITSGFGSDGLPSIEGTAEYLGFPATRVAIGRTDPDLTITEATCHCKKVALFWDECTISASYRAKFKGEHLTDFVVHSAALNDDEVFKLQASHERQYMSAKLNFKREQMGSLSLTMAVWPLYVFASAPCVS